MCLAYPFLFWWLWEYLYFILLPSSNWKYKSWVIVLDQVMMWWRHQMETFSALLALCAGNWWIPLAKASDAELLMFALICAWINGLENNREVGDLKRHRAHYDVTVMRRRCRLHILVCPIELLIEHLYFVISDKYIVKGKHAKTPR